MEVQVELCGVPLIQSETSTGMLKQRIVFNSDLCLLSSLSIISLNFVEPPCHITDLRRVKPRSLGADWCELDQEVFLTWLIGLNVETLRFLL